MAAGNSHAALGYPPGRRFADRFAQVKESQGKSIEQLLDEFASLRTENLAALQALNLQPDDLTRHGMHPELGAVTLCGLLAT